MKTSHALALLIPLLAAPQALAQGTEAQRSACMPDVFRLCASAIPNVGTIKACLAREHARLSPACRTVMDEAGAPRQAEAPPPQRRERVTERRTPVPAVRVATPRRAAHAGNRVVARSAPVCACSARVAARPVRHASRYTAAAHRRHAVRRAGGSGSEMAQAMYWMRTLSGLSGGMSDSMGGLPLGSIAGLMP